MGVTKEIEDKYDDETGVLRRTTTIRTKRPDGTIATRKHKERIAPDSPKYTPRNNKPKVLRKGTRSGCVVAGGIPPSSPPLKSPKSTTTSRTKKRIPSSPGRIPSMVVLQ